MENKVSHLLKIQDEQGSIFDAQVEYFSPSWYEWTLEFTWTITEKLSFTEGDVFECLTKLRLELAKYGYRPLCAGARLNVYPSGMARDMGNGLSAQVMSTEPALDWQDVIHVSIFDYAEPELIASVEEQFNFFGSRFSVSYELKIQHDDGSISDGSIYESSVLEPNKIKFTSPVTKDIEICGVNSFDCLTNLRIELERYEYRPLCNGARSDAYALPDDIETYNGSYVHILTLGIVPTEENQLDTFDYADPNLITSVIEQRGNYDLWLDSIKSIHPSEYDRYKS